ncbi:MAG TPA: PspA/IM30 family protein [Acidimicrobiales bacterium]|nr:PspA/IM30 family protein [Acidimicrobiales bacterium]
MSFFKRAHDIVEAKANRALDKAENPSEMLDLSYEQMLEQITKVRTALVQIAAARKQLELQEDQFSHTVDTLDQQAAQAVALGRDDLAREALSRKAAAQQQIDTLEPQHQQLLDQQQKMTQTLQALQARVNQFRTQKESLKAQYSAAQASSMVNDQIAGISGTFSDSGAALQRAQDKIAAAQAHAGALDELLESGVLEDVGADHGDDIAKQLNALGSTSQVDNELAALKAKAALAAVPPPAALGTGSPTAAAEQGASTEPAQ